MKELPDADRDNFANSGQCSSCNAHAMIHWRTFAKLDEVHTTFECAACQKRFFAVYKLDKLHELP